MALPLKINEEIAVLKCELQGDIKSVREII